MRLKSIRSKLFAFYGVLLLVICIGIGMVSYVTTINALTSSIRESLSQLSKECAKVIQGRIDTQLNAMEALANIDAIKNDKLTMDDKLSILKNEAERGGYKRMGIADTKGSTRYTDGETLDISDRDYFQTALTGLHAYLCIFYE